MIKAATYRGSAAVIALLAVMSPIFYSCDSNEKDKQEHVASYALQNDTIVLAENSTIKTRLATDTVTEQAYKTEWTTAGVAQAIPNSYAEIAPPFAGRVVRSHVRLGQKVAPGSPILEISSPDFFSAQKDYFDARQAYRQAERQRKRQQDLWENGVGAQRELEEAKTAYETKRTALAHASSALQIFNVDLAKIELGKPLVVRSPIAGEIISNDIVLGQYLREDAAPIATVAELSKIWIAAQVKEKDIHHIREMDEVEVNLPALPNDLISGKIYHIQEIVDEETRSVQVLIECDNTDRLLKPGMYVTVHFKDTPRQRILLPTKAVFQHENNQYVFVRLDENRYQKRQVKTGGTSAGSVVIIAGLKAGEAVVNEGGIFLLKDQ